MSEVTRILQAARSEGAPSGATAERLLPLVYDELRRLAAAKMARESPGQTLQPTALVHEVWLKLSTEKHAWENRGHFIRAAAEAMRRILVDRARLKLADKRGGSRQRVPIGTIDLATEAEEDVVMRVHEALQELAVDHPQMAELVKLRFFVGLRIPDAAEFLQISPSTAKRQWTYARAWLLSRLHGK